MKDDPTLLNIGLVVLIGCLLCATIVGCVSAPTVTERARMWASYRARRFAFHQEQTRQWLERRAFDVGQFWSRFQAEVVAELQHAPPAPQGTPDPGSTVPPLYLYHGTGRANMASVFARGIEGRSGGWAFMARDYATARSYGQSRGAGNYVVFRVLAQTAYQRGVAFEKRGDYYVARSVHPELIDFHWTLADFAERQNVAA